MMVLSHSIFTPVPRYFHLDVLETRQYHKSKFLHGFPYSTPSLKKTKITLLFSPPLWSSCPPSFSLPPLPFPPGFSVSVKGIFIFPTTQNKTIGSCPLPFFPQSQDVTKAKLCSSSGPFPHLYCTSLTVPQTGILESPSFPINLNTLTTQAKSHCFPF